MLRINAAITLDNSELDEQFVRASGPGGQNVNKVATAVQLRFNVFKSRSLPVDVRERLIRIAGKRMNAAGEIVISSQRYRTQASNRADARERLASLIRAASHRPKPRKKTKPSAAAKTRRLEEKRRQGKTKRMRSEKIDSD
jgi:ribosome-associated protein